MTTAASSGTVLLRMSGITKRIPGVVALDDVQLSVSAGEVHVLLGENGAGKSTLMKILGGGYHADAGKIELKGREVKINSPRDALDLGIAVIYQEFNLVSHPSVMENVFMGREPRIPGRPGVIDWARMRRETAAILKEPDLPIDPARQVGNLGVAQQQMVDFAAYRLEAGQAVRRSADDRERLVLVLEGHAAVRAGSEDFGVVGSRARVFDGPPPPVILVAPGLPVEIVADAEALVVVASAPAGPVRRTACVAPDEILVEVRGAGQTERRIHHLLPPAAEAGRLIAFEVFTPGGNWSSYPPHKHNTEDPPWEARLEELYFYRFAKPQGSRSSGLHARPLP